MKFKSIAGGLTIASLGGLIAATAHSSTADAAEWKPSGPITVLIGFAAGGGTETQARLIAAELEKRKGWKIIPQNMPARPAALWRVS